MKETYKETYERDILKETFIKRDVFTQKRLIHAKETYQEKPIKQTYERDL